MLKKSLANTLLALLSCLLISCKANVVVNSNDDAPYEGTAIASPNVSHTHDEPKEDICTKVKTLATELHWNKRDALRTFFQDATNEEKLKLTQRLWRAKRRIRHHRTGKYLNLRGQKPRFEPYKPKGSDLAAKGLLPRIETIAKASLLQDLNATICHYTASKSMCSILDQGLFGRETLEAFKIQYVKAAGETIDFHNGDHNVICFGLFEVDHCKLQQEAGYAIINLKPAALLKNVIAGSVFCKQHDLCFQGISAPKTFIAIKGAKEKLKIESTQCVTSICMDGVLLAYEFPEYDAASMPQDESHLDPEKKELYQKFKASINQRIFYDLDQFTAFLVGEFFFALEHPNLYAEDDDTPSILYGPTHGKYATTYTKLSDQERETINQAFIRRTTEFREKLYTKIQLLTDAELRTFVLEIAKAMAQRCKINVYVAFKFNMEDVVSVTSVKSSCRSNVILIVKEKAKFFG